MLRNLWLFSRPHTIIGSAVSIVTLFILNKGSFTADISILILTLMAALGCNIFITGVNQIIDIDLDKINKPELPLAAGDLTIKQAWRIVGISGMVSLVSALICSITLFILILIIMALGVAYSVPPLQLKKHHVPAALAITLVRGILVNLGMTFHYATSLTQKYDCILCWTEGFNCPMPYGSIIPLTIFVTAFSLAIAWFKDLPDTAGDAHFGFRTFPLLYSKRAALMLGTALVGLAYIYCIYWAWYSQESALLFGHIFLAIGFVFNVSQVRIDQMATIKRFYMLFWVFFFAEYILFGAVGYFTF